MNPIALADHHDPRIADYRTVRDADLIARAGLFVAEGRLVIERLLASCHYRVRSFLLNEASLRALAPLIAETAPDVPVFVAGAQLIEAIAGYHVHRGSLALVERPVPADWPSVLGSRPALVIAEHLTNPDNMGALFRNARAFDAAVLLDLRSVDPLYRKAIRTSTAATLVVPYARVDPWEKGLADIRAAGWQLWGLTPHADGVPLELAVAGASASKVALCVGGEADGLSRPALAATDMLVRIPMAPGVDSLNVATATGIALYRLATRP